MTTALKAGDLLHAKLQSILVLLLPSTVIPKAAGQLRFKPSQETKDNRHDKKELYGHGEHQL